MLIASYLYAGFSDYFSGHGCADDDEHVESLLYAYYGCGTKLRDIIDQLVEDSWNGSASEELPEEVTDHDVRKALLGMLSDSGRADYASGAIAECAADMERLTNCPDCNTELGVDDYVDCPECGHCLNDYESPVFIVLLTYEKPESEVSVSNCAGYSESTGCKECSSYSDCGDREEN
jgi:hypothetical protein